jgi:hypothetical protein
MKSGDQFTVGLRDIKGRSVSLSQPCYQKYNKPEELRKYEPSVSLGLNYLPEAKADSPINTS